MNNEIQEYDLVPVSRPLPPPPYSEPEEVRLQDYLNVIYRRRKIFILAFLSVVIGVAVWTFTMRPVYESSATLHVKDEKGNKELLDILSVNSSNPVDAEIEILKSRSNAEQVVQQLHLDWEVSEKSRGPRSGFWNSHPPRKTPPI